MFPSRSKVDRPDMVFPTLRTDLVTTSSCELFVGYSHTQILGPESRILTGLRELISLLKRRQDRFSSDRDLADLRDPVSGDGGGLRIGEPTVFGGHTASMEAAGDLRLLMAGSENVLDRVKFVGYGDNGDPMMVSLIGDSAPAPETSSLDGIGQGKSATAFGFDTMVQPVPDPVESVGYYVNGGRSLGFIAGDRVSVPITSILKGIAQGVVLLVF